MRVSGFALLYAGLDQGNRLDWFNSGVVTGLLLGGGLLIAAFVVGEAFAEYPLIDLRCWSSLMSLCRPC